MNAILKSVSDLVLELNKSAVKHLDLIENIVAKLTAHINEKESLTISEIEKHVDYLINHTVITPISIPLDSSMPLIRAVQYDEVAGNGYSSVSRISYIPYGSGITPKLGRMNIKGQSLFYACLGEQPNSVSTMLSECRAKVGDIFNILHCETNKGYEDFDKRFSPALYMVPIGINEYFRRNESDPFGVNQDYRDIYDCIHKNASPEISNAFHISDKFLTDVLSRTKTGKLYEVTSVISGKCLQSDQIDGVIFPSTQLSGHPSMALKTTSVDSKIIYVKTSSVRVTESNSSNYHTVENLNYGVIKSDKIEWLNTER